MSDTCHAWRRSQSAPHTRHKSLLQQTTTAVVSSTDSRVLARRSRFCEGHTPLCMQLSLRVGRSSNNSTGRARRHHIHLVGPVPFPGMQLGCKLVRIFQDTQSLQGWLRRQGTARTNDSVDRRKRCCQQRFIPQARCNGPLHGQMVGVHLSFVIAAAHAAPLDGHLMRSKHAKHQMRRFDHLPRGLYRRTKMLTARPRRAT